MAGKTLVSTTQLPPGTDTSPDEYTMVGPGPNGEGPRLYTVPKANYQRALDAGWHVATDADEQHEADVKAAMSNIASENGPVNLGEAFGVGNDYFLNEALANVPHTVGHYTDTQAEKEARDRLYAEHPVAAWTGGLLGAAGNLLLTHGIGKVAGTVLGDVAPRVLEAGEKIEEAAPVISKLGRGALTGGAFAVPQAATQAAYNDPESAAETMLWGMGVGAGLSGVSQLAGKGYKGAADLVKSSDWLSADNLNAKADEMTAASLGITPAKASKLGSDRLQEIAKLTENDDFLKTPQVKNLGNYDKAQALQDDAGEKLGQHMTNLDALIDKNPDLQDLRPTPTSLATDLTMQILQDHPEFGITGINADNMDMLGDLHAPPLFESELNALKDITATIKRIGSDDESDPMTMTQLQELKQRLDPARQSAGFWDTAPNGVKQIRMAAYNFIRDKQMQLADEAYNKAGLSSDMADYQLQKQRYRAANDLLQYGEKQYTPNNFGIPLGSHFTNQMGAIAGGVVGGLPGAGIGYGAMLLGKKLLGSYLENVYFRVGARVLRKMANSPVLGDLMAQHGVEAMQQHVGESHNFLWRSVKNLPVQQANPLRHFLGDKANGLSKQQQYDAVSADVTSAATNPAFMKDHVDAIKHIFGNNPELASLVVQKNQAAINLLYNMLPKNPNPPRLFDKSTWAPTLQDQTKFANALAIVQDPMTIMNKAAMGTLTQDDINIANQVYPKIMAALKNHLTLIGSSKDTPEISQGMKQSMELITGQRILNPNGINYQSAYVGAQAPNAPPATRGRGKGHTISHVPEWGWGNGSRAPKADKMPSLETKVDRLDRTDRKLR